MIKLFLLSLLLFFNSCSDLEPEMKRKTTSVKISHNIFNSNNRSISINEDLFPVYHLISVEPNIEVLMLDNDMTAEVLVPVDTSLWIEYINWTQEQPDIYYQSGISDDFIVTHDSPERIKIWIDTKINPDYPFQEEETTTDEEEDTTEDEDIVIEEDIIEEEETEPETEEEEIDATLLAHYKFEGDLTDSSSYGRDLELCTGSTAFSYSIANFQGWDGPSGQAAWFYGGQCAENEFNFK